MAGTLLLDSEITARKATIAHALLVTANDDLEHLDRLLSADELDRRELQDTLNHAWRLTAIVEEELKELDRRG